MTRLRLFISCSLAACLAAACSSSSTITAATLNAPGGMVVAGPAHDRLFIANANENALQVAVLNSTLTALEFERGDALHFPLRVLAGPQPGAIAATPDGRYIVVLNGSGETLRLIDAKALEPATTKEPRTAIAVVAGPPGSAPADLVAAATGPATACTAPCRGRFFVSLSGAGAVAAFEVRVVDDEPELVATRIYDVRGSGAEATATPGKLAPHPDGALLFVTDTTNDEVIRLDLQSGAVLDRLAVGDTPGPIAVSTDGTVLIAGRPRLRDLVLFGALTSAAPSPLPANPVFAPALSCIDTCDLPDVKCREEHVALASVCGRAGDDGLALAPGTSDYQALYLPGVPLRLLPIGADPSTAARQLKVTCADDTTAPPSTFDQWVMVALSNGELTYVSLRPGGSSELAPALVSTHDCKAPSLVMATKSIKPTLEAPPLEQILAACPPTPEGHGRFRCTGAPGVVVFPGVTGIQSWTLDWEGTIVTRAAGGTFTPDKKFKDIVNDLGSIGVKEGDTLQITTPLRGDPACTASLTTQDAGKPCHLEWRVTAVDTDDDGATLLTLTPPAPEPAAACWPTDGSIGYTIRAGGKYWLSVNGTAVGRADWGTTVGPGGTVGESATALFTLASSGIPKPSGNACADYDAAGTFIGSIEQQKLYSRGNAFAFVVSDAFKAYQPRYTTTNTGSAIAGTLPSDMKLVQLPAAAGQTEGAWAVFVSFGASNSILGLFPFDTQTVGTEGNSVVLR